jgi:TRAP-type C4-dicarboxylate transport system permease small subunit
MRLLSAPSVLPEMVARWRGRLVALVSWGAFAAFATIFVVNILQITLRQFGGGWIWVHDLSALLFAWTVMLGAAAAYGKFDHVVASFLIDKLSPASSKVLAYFVRLIELVVGLSLTVGSLSVVETRMNINYIQLGIPTGWAYLSVLTLGVLMLIFALTAPVEAIAKEEIVSPRLASGSEKRE